MVHFNLITISTLALAALISATTTSPTLSAATSVTTSSTTTVRTASSTPSPPITSAATSTSLSTPTSTTTIPPAKPTPPKHLHTHPNIPLATILHHLLTHLAKPKPTRKANPAHLLACLLDHHSPVKLPVKPPGGLLRHPGKITNKKNRQRLVELYITALKARILKGKEAKKKLKIIGGLIGKGRRSLEFEEEDGKGANVLEMGQEWNADILGGLRARGFDGDEEEDKGANVYSFGQDFNTDLLASLGTRAVDDDEDEDKGANVLEMGQEWNGDIIKGLLARSVEMVEREARALSYDTETDSRYPKRHPSTITYDDEDGDKGANVYSFGQEFNNDMLNSLGARSPQDLDEEEDKGANVLEFGQEYNADILSNLNARSPLESEEDEVKEALYDWVKKVHGRSVEADDDEEKQAFWGIFKSVFGGIFGKRDVDVEDE
ncbi:hypothetical protein BJ508DRAFT_309586 [Ascobolus immersus RN42]|uniref:Uncharacterized protein n=1 Tax=Ascobolus immersus RN42 TaxID=1160509 RepID=A0A3N4HW89_ASCIM|nr:hypothetical protein BJ508DRAFT_309586 [Ascobolus immersus RN42]